MTTVHFQRVDGHATGESIAMPKGRRRLSSIVRAHADRSRPHIVSLHRKKHVLAVTDFSVRLRKTWRNTTVGPHDTVIIVYLPQGGGGATGGRGGGKATGAAIGLVVASIALMALGQFWAIGALNGALGLAATSSVGSAIWAAGTAALLAGGGYLLSKATQAKANKEAENRPVYGVSGGGNLPRSGDRIPSIYGRCWNAPDLSQPDYTVYDGDDQILYKRLTIGCGKYSIKSVRVGGITMWTSDGGLTPPFSGASIEVIQPGGTSSLVPGAVATVQAVTGNELPRAADFPNWAGPFDFGVDAPAQTRIQLDFSLPQGCYAVPKSGKFQGQQFPTDWGALFEFAPCDEDGTPTGAWSYLYAEAQSGVTITRAQRFTRFVDIPSGRYAFRARNVGPAAEVEHPSGFTADITNAVIWEGLRAHVPEVITRPGVTELALVVRSGKALGVTSYGEVEVESSRILPVWFGPVSGWIEQETNKCVWAAADILRNQLHGAGIPDSAIDLQRLLHYASTLSKFDTFSGVIRGPVSVYEALTTVLGTMRASPLRLGNVWTIVRDEAKSVRKHVISRRQIIRDSSAQTFTLDLSDGSADIIVEWMAGGDPKRRREKRQTFGTITATPRRMSAFGVTDAEHAIHLATWAGATAYYRRERRSVTTELAGRLLMPNDSAMIDVWYFDAVQTAGITGRDGLLIEVDTEIALPPNAYAILRARDGKEWGPVAVTMDGSRLALNALDVAQAQLLSGITLENVLNTQTQAFTSIVIGTLAESQDAWLVRSIRHAGDNRIDVEAVFDAPQVWSALNEAIIPPPPPPSSGLENDGSLIIPYIRATAVQRNGAMFMDWTCGRVRQAAEYVVQISYDNWATFETAHRGAATSGSYPLRETTGTVWVRAYVISATGNVSLTVSTQFSLRPAQLNLDNAIHGSLKIEAFTDGIEPVGLVDGLPDPAGYTGPTLVFDTNTEKVYKLQNGEWVPLVNTEDLDGTISETQIDNNSISTPKLKANAVTTAKLAAGAVTANEIAANAVIAGKIQAGAVSADKINVTKLDAISADLGSITAGSLNINNRFIVAANGELTVQSSTGFPKTVQTSAAYLAYDAGGNLRVRMGNW